MDACAQLGLHEHRPSALDEMGEVDLWAAALRQARNDLDDGTPKQREQARAWLLSDACKAICEAHGVDHTYVRRKLREEQEMPQRPPRKCGNCGKPVTQPPTGAPKRYCNGNCGYAARAKLKRQSAQPVPSDDDPRDAPRVDRPSSTALSPAPDQRVDGTATLGVLLAVHSERQHQEQLAREGKFAYTCADAIPDRDRLLVLIEEVGEVARAVLGNADAGNLRAELVQVAAVAVAWVEGLDADKQRGAAAGEGR